VIVHGIEVIYLSVMFHMPNRIFYAQFENMDAAKLKQTVDHVLLYTTLELLSYVSTNIALRRMLRISPMRQLAFVLTRQGIHVQAALILWVTFSTQTSLQHYGELSQHRVGSCGSSLTLLTISCLKGCDYSFKFPWLEKLRGSSGT
jgi:hypothetical protein